MSRRSADGTLCFTSSWWSLSLAVRSWPPAGSIARYEATVSDFARLLRRRRLCFDQGQNLLESDFDVAGKIQLSPRSPRHILVPKPSFDYQVAQNFIVGFFPRVSECSTE